MCQFPTLTLIFVLSLLLVGMAQAGQDDLGRIEPFKPGEVKLKDGLLKRSFDVNLKYLKSLDNDMLLYCYRYSSYLRYPGTSPGGWEHILNPNRGTFLGHWLSGAAKAIAVSGDPDLKTKADFIVGELRKCQVANGGGWVEAWGPERVYIMEGKHGGDPAFEVITAPYYGIHKLLAGFIDMNRLGGNKEALVAARGLADWLCDRCKVLPDAQLQKMLEREHGGIVEPLSELSAMTGDTKYVELARRMRHRAVVDPLEKGEDKLDGLHANTQLPKFNGDGSLYKRFGDKASLAVLRNAYNLISSTRMFVTGGSNSREYWGPANKLEETLGTSTEESCTTYNWMKMTRYLQSFEGAARYGDMLELCLYSGLLPTHYLETGMFTYFLPLTKGGAKKDWGTPTDSFWCCYGTMIENFGDPSEGAYFHAPGLLVVNLFTPSEISFEGIRLEQQTSMPESEVSTLTVHTASPTKLTLAIRIPSWTTNPSVKINGESVPAQPGTFCKLERTWQEGDKVELSFPMWLRWEALLGSPELKAAVYGPVVLGGVSAASVGLDEKDLALKPTDRKLEFTTTGLHKVGDRREVRFKPFYAITDEAFGVYFPIGRPAVEDKAYETFSVRVQDDINIAEAKSEKAHGFKPERSNTGQAPDGQPWRDTVDGWFEYSLKVSPGKNDLAVKYWGGEEGNRTFEILVDGKPLKTMTLDKNKPGEFFWDIVSIPQGITNGKDHVTVRFQSKDGNTAGGVFGIATLRP